MTITHTVPSALVERILGKTPTGKTLKWLLLYHDPRDAWQACECPHAMAEILVAVGYSYDEVVATAISACEGQPYLKMRVETRAHEWRTPAGAYNTYVTLLNAADLDGGPVCEVLRELFPYEEVLAKVK